MEFWDQLPSLGELRRRSTLEEQRTIPSWHGLSLFVYIIICRQLKLVGEGWTGLEEVEEVERGLVTVNSRLMSEREVQHKHATIRATNNHQHRSPAPVSLSTSTILCAGIPSYKVKVNWLKEERKLIVATHKSKNVPISRCFCPNLCNK